MGIAVYPGSFDPVHLGHLDVIRRASQLFDRVIVAVAENVEKGRGAFSLDERVAMLRDAIGEMPSVEVAAQDALEPVQDFKQRLHRSPLHGPTRLDASHDRGRHDAADVAAHG